MKDSGFALCPLGDVEGLWFLGSVFMIGWSGGKRLLFTLYKGNVVWYATREKNEDAVKKRGRG